MPFIYQLTRQKSHKKIDTKIKIDYKYIMKKLELPEIGSLNLEQVKQRIEVGYLDYETWVCSQKFRDYLMKNLDSEDKKRYGSFLSRLKQDQESSRSGKYILIEKYLLDQKGKVGINLKSNTTPSYKLFKSCYKDHKTLAKDADLESDNQPYIYGRVIGGGEYVYKDFNHLELFGRSYTYGAEPQEVRQNIADGLKKAPSILFSNKLNFPMLTLEQVDVEAPNEHDVAHFWFSYLQVKKIMQKT
jgi:hypothetical protein